MRVERTREKRSIFWAYNLVTSLVRLLHTESMSFSFSAGFSGTTTHIKDY